MKKVVWIFGLVIGVIMCINMFVMVNMLYTNLGLKTNDVVGYAAMVVMFSLIYFGVRNYRNKYLVGLITFGKAFKTGLLIAVIGSTMYVLVWLFYYYLFVPDFIDVYTNHVLNACTLADYQEKAKEMAEFKQMYKNPVFIVLITYFEVLPVGIIVALISALILKRKAKIHEQSPQ